MLHETFEMRKQPVTLIQHAANCSQDLPQAQLPPWKAA